MMNALLPAELAWYVTGRFYRATDGSLADYRSGVTAIKVM
jgi:hypothetical protein